MGYEGSFNSFTFGDGARPGASVKTLAGWRGNRAQFDVSSGSVRNVSSPPRFPATDILLGLNLHASTAGDLDDLIDRVLEAFQPSATPLPMVVDGLAKWVQVKEATPLLAPDWPGAEVTTEFTAQLVAEDPVLYAATPTTAWTTASATASATFEAPNDGRLVPFARRAWDVSITAATTLTNLTIRVDHDDDSTWEQIQFQGTITAGQTLTVGADLLPRVGTAIRSGWVRSLTQAGLASRAPRWWDLHPSTGSDDNNEVTISAASGTFTGTVLTRSTR